MSLIELARPEVLALPEYEVNRARAGARLDTNELALYGDGLHRYPAPDDGDLTSAMAGHYRVGRSRVQAVRGSDDAIDALGRAFLVPGKDAVMVSPPTFEMYAHFARLQGAGVDEVPLSRDSSHHADALVEAWRPGIKLIYICTPNNPTGSVMETADIAHVCTALAGRALVVVDEAYQEFSSKPSALGLLDAHPNLVVLRTLSKAFGLAAIRCGALFAMPEVVRTVRRVLPPYLLPGPTVRHAITALTPDSVCAMRERVADIVKRRDELARILGTMAAVRDVTASEGNFLLVRMHDAAYAYDMLAAAGLLVRHFRGGLADSLRITIGTPDEMSRLVDVLGSLHA